MNLKLGASFDVRQAGCVMASSEQSRFGPGEHGATTGGRGATTGGSGVTTGGLGVTTYRHGVTT